MEEYSMENLKSLKSGVLICVALLVFSLAIVCVPSVSEAASLEYSWQTETPMGDNRSQAVVVDDGEGLAYIIGGSSQIPTVAVDNVSLYNLITGEWIELESIPTAVRGACGVYQEGKIYVFGGAIESGVKTNATQIYDVTTDSWSTGEPVLVSIWESKAVLHEGKIFIIGGEGNADGLQIYDIATDSWSTGANLPSSVLAGVAYCDDNSIWYVGGSYTDYTAVNTVYTYSIAMDYWSTHNPLPMSITAATGVLGHDDVLYLMGGADNAGNFGATNYDSAYFFNDVDWEWMTFDPMPNGMRYASSVFYDNTVYVLGGNNQSETFDSVYSYQLYQIDLELESTTVGQGETLGATITIQHALFNPVSGYNNIMIIGPGETTYPMGEEWFVMNSETVGMEIVVPESAEPGEYTFSLIMYVSYDRANCDFSPINETFTVVAAPSIAERIQQMQEEFNATLADMTAQLDQLQSDLDALQGDLSDMEDQLNNMSDLVDSTEKTVNDMTMFMYIIIVLLIVVLVMLVVVMVKK
jgi:N-acetylneuraminic acid mutarotase